jgi:hypothetical protein
MDKFDSATALAQLVGSLPTLIAVLLAWMHSNARFGDLQNTVNQRINDLRSELKDNTKAEAALIRAEFRRVEERAH